jgi:hypothetical protein
MRFGASGVAGLLPPAGERKLLAPPVTEVLEYRPHEDGYLQLELRRYIRRDGSARERGPYWYFQYFAPQNAPPGATLLQLPCQTRKIWRCSKRGFSKNSCK